MPNHPDRHGRARRAAALGLLLALSAGSIRASDQDGCPAFDHTHGAWTVLLQRFVHDASVDYGAWTSSGARALDGYLASLAGVSRACYASWSREEQLAFWIDAYNAYTVRLILDHHPIASIRSIGWLPGSAFRTKFIPMERLEERTLSLDDVEHRIIRPRFADARVHFALVCASKGCPPLRAEAYRASDLERQLDEQARTFINDPAKNRYDATRRILRLSSIFEWFGEDFERAAGSTARFVARYAKGPMADAARDPAVRIEFLDYDWSLNGQ
jgi:hypothetical protein